MIVQGPKTGKPLPGSEEAIACLIRVGREQFAIDFSGGNFDSCVWDVRPFHTRTTTCGNNNLYFTRLGSIKEPLPQYYSDVAKSWVVLDRRSVSQMEQKTRAARLLWEALLVRRGLHPEEFCWDTLCAEDFYQAELIAPEHWDEATVYIATRYLALFGQFLSARGICQQLYLAFQAPHPQSTTRHTLAGPEARKAKLPSRAALQGLADIYSTHAVEPRDRLLIDGLAILIVTGFRIGELLTLPVDCEVEEERSGVSRYGLRYYKEKSRGGAKMLAIRWLTAVGAELAKKAIEEIRTITAPFRERALVLERDPNRVPLPGFGWADHIRAKELASILGMSWRSNSVYHISREKLPRHQDEDGIYYLASEVEAYLLTQREEHLWTLNRKDGTHQKLSQTLLIAPRFFFSSYNGTNLLLIEPVDYSHIENFLTSYTQDRKSAFERFAIRGDDGSYCRLTSHQFRHWLNDVADKGGLPVDLQTRWLGREDARDTEAYRHATMDERIQWVKNGIRDGQISGMLASVYFQLPEEERDIFLEGQVQAVHFTALGLCLHDYSIEPCPFHLNCTRRCRDYLRRKGNLDERRNLIQIQKQTKKALALVQEQLTTENAAIAEPWIRHYEETLEGVEAALAIDDDPLTPDNSLVQPFEGLPSRFQPLSLTE